MESDYHWLVTVGLVTSSVIAVAANSFLLVVFGRRRGLRTVPNRFVINLLITNLLSSILLIPLLLVDQHAETSVTNSTRESNETIQEVNGLFIQEEVVSTSDTKDTEIFETSERIITETISFVRNESSLLCNFAQGATTFVCTASIFSILLIGINQYFGVIHSLRYHFYINRCRSTIFIAASWLGALVCAILSSLTHSGSSLWHFCEASTNTSESLKILNTVYVFTYFTLVILVPFVAICVIYMCIYTAAHQNSERMRKSTSAGPSTPPPMDYIQMPVNICDKRQNLPKVHSAPNLSELQKRFSETSDNSQKPRNKVKRTSSDRNANNFIANLKHRISNASVFRYREETRAAKISILVIFMVLICYVPYGISLVLTSDCIRVNPTEIFNYLSLVLLVFSNILSPFLFGYRNKRVKREIGKIFGLVHGSNQNLSNIDNYRKRVTVRRSFGGIEEAFRTVEPLLEKNLVVPEVVVTYKQENERKSILKRVCNSTGWSNYKKCSFITVPDSCLGDARGSFSSASTQMSNEE